MFWKLALLFHLWLVNCFNGGGYGGEGFMQFGVGAKVGEYVLQWWWQWVR